MYKIQSSGNENNGKKSNPYSDSMSMHPNDFDSLENLSLMF